MDFNNQVLIVDVANIRDHAPETMKSRRHEGRDVPLSSLEYLDTALDALEYQVPSGTVLKIADFSLLYNFPDNEKTEFKRRTNLEPTDPQFIYLLPNQSKKAERWSGRLRNKPGDNVGFIEADDVILSLAVELDAYVVSGDSYSDEKFDHQMKSIRDRLFVHRCNPESNSWVFVKSIEYFSEHHKKRDSWDHIKSLTTIARVIGDSRSFDRQSDFDIRNFAFNTLIEEFWENKPSRVTVDQDRQLTSNPFKNRLGGVLSRPSHVGALPRQLSPLAVSQAVTSNNWELVPSAASMQLSKEIHVDQVSLPMPTYYASAVHAISKHKDERIAIMGKLVQGGMDLFIEWVLSDKRIKILVASDHVLPRLGELVRITGTVHQDDGDITLEVGSRDTVVTIDFADVVKERVDKVRRSQPKMQRGYWILPSMKWGGRPVSPSGSIVESGFVPRPIPNSFPNSSSNIPKVPLVTQTDVNPIRLSGPADTDWSVNPILAELDGFQPIEPVMTSLNSFGRIQFLETVVDNRRAAKVRRSWTVAIAIALGFAVAFALYLSIKYGSEIAPPVQRSGWGFGLKYR
jgi:hypothetical protein